MLTYRIPFTQTISFEPPVLTYEESTPPQTFSLLDHNYKRVGQDLQCNMLSNDLVRSKWENC